MSCERIFPSWCRLCTIWAVSSWKMSALLQFFPFLVSRHCLQQSTVLNHVPGMQDLFCGKAELFENSVPAATAPVSAAQQIMCAPIRPMPLTMSEFSKPTCPTQC